MNLEIELLTTALQVAGVLTVLIVLCRIKKLLACIEFHTDKTAQNTERSKLLK